MTEPAFGLDDIGQIHITVDDLPRAVAYYRDVLGMRLLFEVPGQPMAFFQCGSVRLYLGQPEGSDFRSNPLLYYRVADIRAAVATLRGRGVAFESDAHLVHKDDRHELWMAGFRDSEGNHASLMSEVPVSAP
jgi:catechol 2,3-dioxygenase-like lactoylglutathione lyase family enzyme